MEGLAASMSPEELNRRGFALYEAFRPAIPAGARDGVQRVNSTLIGSPPSFVATRVRNDRGLEYRGSETPYSVLFCALCPSGRSGVAMSAIGGLVLGAATTMARQTL